MEPPAGLKMKDRNWHILAGLTSDSGDELE